MAKYSLLGHLEGEQAIGALPPDFRDRARVAVTPGVRYAVVLFPHNREQGGVSTSTLVQRALAQLPVDDPVLAVGHDFTLEATGLLVERGAKIVRIGEFGWTDASTALR